MDLSNLIWHLGAFVFGLWAAILAIKAKRSSKACVEALLPVLFAETGTFPRALVRSTGARIFEFFEQELTQALQVRCSIARSPLRDGEELRAAATALWQLLPQAARLDPSFSNAFTPFDSAFEFEGTRVSALRFQQMLKGSQAQPHAPRIDRLAFQRVSAEPCPQSEVPASGSYWQVSRNCTRRE